MVVIKRIGVMSFAKIEALLMAVMGLILGIIVAVMQVVDPSIAVASGPDPLLSMGFWIVLLLPVQYAVMGFIAGLLGSVFYNLFSGWIGGIEIELEEKGQAMASHKKRR
ncbi:hypothetical protein JW711_03755 [Candidatus Woesearchaeota archaeon]|nr:hypothetical protein [Candidatus Woesearchaeota archaeon]